MDAVRSLLLLPPGSRPPDVTPDATLLDLSAAEPPDRDAARRAAAQLVERGHRLYLHVHPVATRAVRDDLLGCLIPGVYGVSVPGLLAVTQLRYVDSALEEAESNAGITPGLTALGGWIASAGALVHAADIARASHRLTWLGLDGPALRTELDLTASGPDHALDYPRATVLFAARAAGLPAVDGSETDATVEAEIAAARGVQALGLRGKLTASAAVARAFESIFPAPRET